MAPEFVEKRQDFDYMENVCVTGENRCNDGINQFILEDNVELINRKDAMAMPLGTTMEQCRKICRDDKGMLPFLCKSYHFARDSKLCLLSENGQGLQVTNSSKFSYHEAICIQGGNKY